MNGPQHYLEAERLAANAHQALDTATENTFDEALAASVPILARAQVHATLALAAAVASANVRTHLSALEVDREWAEAMQP